MSTIRVLGGARIAYNGGPGIIQVGKDGVIEVGDAEIVGNHGPGIVQREHTLLEQLRLPDQTDPKELAALLKVILGLPEEEQKAKVVESGLYDKIKAFVVDGSTLVNNVVSLANSPQIQQIIQALSA